jgi:hypothetical protein
VREPPKIFSDDRLKGKNIDSLKRYLRSKLGGYRVAFADITTGNLLYRGVPWQQRPSKVKDVSYPPCDRVTKLGRINRIGKPVFYCSLAAHGVFYELRAKRGDLIALSEWEVVEPVWMHNLGYHEDTLRKMGAAEIATRSRFINPIPNNTKQHEHLRCQLSLAFTEDVREDQNYRYKQSIAINELLFDGASPFPQYLDGPKSNRAAGTVYPAIRMRGSADNVAIWPEFVDSSLRIRSVRYVLVEAADEATSSYTLLTRAISTTFHGSDIVWQEALLPENRRRSHIALEGDNWVIRDGDNCIYDLH